MVEPSSRVSKAEMFLPSQSSLQGKADVKQMMTQLLNAKRKKSWVFGGHITGVLDLSCG